MPFVSTRAGGFLISVEFRSHTGSNNCTSVLLQVSALVGIILARTGHLLIVLLACSLDTHRELWTLTFSSDFISSWSWDLLISHSKVLPFACSYPIKKEEGYTFIQVLTRIHHKTQRVTYNKYNTGH